MKLLPAILILAVVGTPALARVGDASEGVVATTSGYFLVPLHENEDFEVRCLESGRTAYGGSYIWLADSSNEVNGNFVTWISNGSMTSARLGDASWTYDWERASGRLTGETIWSGRARSENILRVSWAAWDFDVSCSVEVEGVAQAPSSTPDAPRYFRSLESPSGAALGAEGRSASAGSRFHHRNSSAIAVDLSGPFVVTEPDGSTSVRDNLLTSPQEGDWHFQLIARAGSDRPAMFILPL